ncbi:MAG: hypothetical protein JOZ82_00080, partial [Marmoricola sp.]|nr:hypothetical protein [Marmoricola sp.]
MTPSPDAAGSAAPAGWLGSEGTSWNIILAARSRSLPSAEVVRERLPTLY